MSESSNSQKNDEDNDLFYFESDHQALRGNRDYSDLLKTMFVLQAQRQKAIEDYRKTLQIKKECLENPIECLSKLKNDTLGVPAMQRIIDVPKVNWSKYSVKIPQHYLQQAGGSVDLSDQASKPDANGKKTLSVPWTSDEQRKLEELLLKYPVEDTESGRVKKIATELGTRTSKQVSSRLQKYFLKLHKAGLPIPGRIPKNMSSAVRKSNKHKYMKPSTFFPHLDIPVMMNESEEVPGPSTSCAIDIATNPSNYLMSSNYHEDKSEDKSDVEKQLELLRRIRNEKVNDNGEEYKFRHYGYKCDYCEEEPIEGSRWHCKACINDSIDYCTDCLISQMHSDEPHPTSHKFIIIRNDKVTLDSSDTESTTGSSVKNEGSEDSSSVDEDCVGFANSDDKSLSPPNGTRVS